MQHPTNACRRRASLVARTAGSWTFAWALSGPISCAARDASDATRWRDVIRSRDSESRNGASMTPTMGATNVFLKHRVGLGAARGAAGIGRSDRRAWPSSQPQPPADHPRPTTLDEVADDQGDEYRGKKRDGDRRETVADGALSGNTSGLLVHWAGPFLLAATIFDQEPRRFQAAARCSPDVMPSRLRCRPTRNPAAPAREWRRWRRTSRAPPPRAVSRRSRGTCPGFQ